VPNPTRFGTGVPSSVSQHSRSYSNTRTAATVIMHTQCRVSYCETLQSRNCWCCCNFQCHIKRGARPSTTTTALIQFLHTCLQLYVPSHEITGHSHLFISCLHQIPSIFLIKHQAAGSELLPGKHSYGIVTACDYPFVWKTVLQSVLKIPEHQRTKKSPQMRPFFCSILRHSTDKHLLSATLYNKIPFTSRQSS